MQTRSDEGLYEALETELRKAKEPLDCVDLFDKASVRAHATTVNRVSDYLGNLWRKGKLTRLPAPPNEGRKARWLYVWKGRPKTPRPTIEEARQYNRVILKRPNIEISEEGDTITIELPQFTLTFKPRPQ